MLLRASSLQLQLKSVLLMWSQLLRLLWRSVLGLCSCGGALGRSRGCLWRHSEKAVFRSKHIPCRRGGFWPVPSFYLIGGFNLEIADIVALYVECIQIALPFTIVFYLGEFVTSTILRTAFGGKLTFKSF